MLRDFRPYNERTEAERGALWDNFITSERMKRSQNFRMELNFYYKILGHILLNIRMGGLVCQPFFCVLFIK